MVFLKALVVARSAAASLNGRKKRMRCCSSTGSADSRSAVMSVDAQQLSDLLNHHTHLIMEPLELRCARRAKNYETLLLAGMADFKEFILEMQQLTDDFSHGSMSAENYAIMIGACYKEADTIWDRVKEAVLQQGHPAKRLEEYFLKATCERSLRRSLPVDYSVAEARIAEYRNGTLDWMERRVANRDEVIALLKSHVAALERGATSADAMNQQLKDNIKQLENGSRLKAAEEEAKASSERLQEVLDARSAIAHESKLAHEQIGRAHV